MDFPERDVDMFSGECLVVSVSLLMRVPSLTTKHRFYTDLQMSRSMADTIRSLTDSKGSISTYHSIIDGLKRIMDGQAIAHEQIPFDHG